MKSSYLKKWALICFFFPFIFSAQDGLRAERLYKSLPDSVSLYVMINNVKHYIGGQPMYKECNDLFYAQDLTDLKVTQPADWNNFSKNVVSDLSILSDSLIQIRFDTSKYDLISKDIIDFLCQFTPVNKYVKDYDPDLNEVIRSTQKKGLKLYDMGVLHISDKFESRLIVDNSSSQERRVFLINSKGGYIHFIMCLSYVSDYRIGASKEGWHYGTAKRLDNNLFWIKFQDNADTYFSFDDNGQIIWNVDQKNIE